MEINTTVKNYMSIGVSVRKTKFAARNNGIGVRQDSNLQSPTVFRSKVMGHFNEADNINNEI